MATMNLKLGNTVDLVEEEELEADISRAERKAILKAQASKGKKKVQIRAESENGSDEDDEPMPEPGPSRREK